MKVQQVNYTRIFQPAGDDPEHRTSSHCIAPGALGGQPVFVRAFSSNHD
jgi:hypothetical protein